jgi:hypothetical protein
LVIIGRLARATRARLSRRLAASIEGYYVPTAVDLATPRRRTRVPPQRRSGESAKAGIDDDGCACEMRVSMDVYASSSHRQKISFGAHIAAKYFEPSGVMRLALCDLFIPHMLSCTGQFPHTDLRAFRDEVAGAPAPRVGTARRVLAWAAGGKWSKDIVAG